MKNSDKDKKYNSDITKDDLSALGDKSQVIRNEAADDSRLKDREKEVDFTGEGLDVPGRTLPSNRPGTKLKDEENQLYSQGSESNENLESNTE